MIDPTERIHKKNPDPKIILKSIDLLSRYQEKRPTRYKKNLNPRIRIKILDRYPLKMTESYRYRIHKSRIRRLDPKELNTGPDLQLYERVPIQKRGTGFKKTRGTDIKKMDTDTKRDTGFKKNCGTDTKTKVPIRYRTRKREVLHKSKLKDETDIRTKILSAEFVKNIINLRYQKGTYHL